MCIRFGQRGIMYYQTLQQGVKISTVDPTIPRNANSSQLQLRASTFASYGALDQAIRIALRRVHLRVCACILQAIEPAEVCQEKVSKDPSHQEEDFCSTHQSRSNACSADYSPHSPPWAPPPESAQP